MPGSPATEYYLHHGHFTRKTFSKQASENKALAPSSAEPIDVDGPPVPVPFTSVKKMSIPALDPIPANSRAQTGPAHEDK
jgi:hypothetical protein